MRRIIVPVLVALVAILALGTAVVAGGSSSTVTRARLERSLPAAFAHLYVQQARLLGRTDVTVASLHPQAMCDKHGADVADVGPGGDWVCLMSWHDPQVPMPPEGYGKFELNVHSNDCYTAGGPTKLTGFLTITDKSGKEVTNPVFEFDACFDPQGDNTATGNSFPSLTNVTSTTLTTDAQGAAALQISCGTGSQGCTGTVVVTAGKRTLGEMRYSAKEEATASLALPAPVPPGVKEVTFEVRPDVGVGPSGPVTLPVQRR
ncbi:MAG: hypothetical protein JWN22_1982 [Nocardioides sp.]|jgi:hypothetical protein|nr:hypothetical protein [Nocardioides sp.]